MPTPIVGDEFPLNHYLYAQIIPLPDGRFAVDRYDGGFYTGDLVMGVYEIDNAGGITTVNELVDPALVGLSGGDEYCLIKTGESRWVLYSPEDNVLVGYALINDVIIKTVGIMPATVPDIGIGFAVSAYDPVNDVGFAVTPTRTISTIQWRDGDSAPSVTGWHEHNLSAPHANDYMLPRPRGGGVFDVMVEETFGDYQRMTFDIADITSYTLSSVYGAPDGWFTTELLGDTLYWEAFAGTTDLGSYIGKSDPGGSIIGVIPDAPGGEVPLVDDDYGYLFPSISPEAGEGEILIGIGVDSPDIYFRTVDDPTNLKVFGPSAGFDYYPTAPGAGMNRVVSGGYSWQPVCVEQYVNGQGRIEGSHLFWFGWPTLAPPLRRRQTDSESERLGGAQRVQARSKQNNPRRIGGAAGKNSYW